MTKNQLEVKIEGLLNEDKNLLKKFEEAQTEMKKIETEIETKIKPLQKRKDELEQILYGCGYSLWEIAQELKRYRRELEELEQKERR